MKKILQPLNNLFSNFSDENENISSIYKFHNIDNVDWSKFDIAILGISSEEEMGIPNAIRKQLYKLYLPENISIIELGNLLLSSDFQDKTKNIKIILDSILSKNIKLIVLGTKKRINSLFHNYFSEKNEEHSIVRITEKFKKNNVSNIKHPIILGYQNYLVSKKETINSNIKAFRLSEVQADFLEYEPYFRTSIMTEINLSSIKFSDAPGTKNPQPNGFSAYEICKLANYAGLSEELNIFSIYNYNIKNDINKVTAKLSGQIIWHFIDALSRKKNFTNLNANNYSNYFVKISEGLTLNFSHCSDTDRWWIKNHEHKISACSYNDYNQAKENKLSTRIKKILQLK